jgi:hypothetical protein
VSRSNSGGARSGLYIEIRLGVFPLRYGRIKFSRRDMALLVALSWPSGHAAHSAALEHMGRDCIRGNVRPSSFPPVVRLTVPISATL